MAAVDDYQLKDSVRKEYSEGLSNVPAGGRLARRKEAPPYCGLPEFYCVTKDGPSGAAPAPRTAPTPTSGAPSTRRRSSGSPTLPLRRTTNG
eukprot:65839-Lingulodinium_polyedra.AAC.1